MASGLPMIVSNSFGAADFVGKGGKILADPNDVEELARYMTELLESPDGRKAMGLAGRENALKMQWPAMAASYLNVYEGLLQAKSA
jgi:glycosyltransferase involved in cell wall biosynthesis